MDDDNLVTQGAMESAIMILVLVTKNISSTVTTTY